MLAIAEEQNISHAAKKLFISQSALNQQLLNLETELGAKLFERFHGRMLPTAAGAIYLKNARRIHEIKDETYKQIADISNNPKGEIRIAFTPERGTLQFSEIYPEFHRRFPGVTFKIREARVKRGAELLRHGEVDLAMLAYSDGETDPDFTYYDMAPELAVLALPKTHDLAYLAGGESWRTFPDIDLKLLEHYPFVLISKETRLRGMVDEAFRLAGYQPHALFETANSFTVVNAVKNQIAAGFFPQSYVDKDAPMVYFSFNHRTAWMRAIVSRKGAYLSRSELAFIDLARENLKKS